MVPVGRFERKNRLKDKLGYEDKPMPELPAPQPDSCTFCLKQFPADLKAQMKAEAARQRQTLHDWLVNHMRLVVATSPRPRSRHE
jgi:hypothetical protein